MQITVEINGVDTPVEVADNYLDERIYRECNEAELNFYHDIIVAFAEKIKDMRFEDSEDLTESELDWIIDDVALLEEDCENSPGMYRRRIARDIASNKLESRVIEAVQKVMDDRLRLYEYTVEFTGCFYVKVKAHSQEEADNFIRDCDYEQFAEYVEPINARELDYACISYYGQEDFSECEEYLDATE